MDKIPELKYDIIEYIMNIKDKEEKLDKIETTQKNNYNFVIKELQISFKRVYRYNRRHDEDPLSIIDYVNLQDEKVMMDIHHLTELKEDTETIKNILINELESLFMDSQEEDILPSNCVCQIDIDDFERELDYFKRFDNSKKIDYEEMIFLKK